MEGEPHRQDTARQHAKAGREGTMAVFNFGRRANDTAHAAVAVDDEADITLDEGDGGPGWYGSSWDLRCGLVVSEGLPADAQLHEWLECHLHAQPVAWP
jgi:hypothetical protein